MNRWWSKVDRALRRVWIAIALRFRFRSKGLQKLRKDIKKCEYEDVHVMWDMLNKPETEIVAPIPKKRKSPLWKTVMTTSRVPNFCRKL